MAIVKSLRGVDPHIPASCFLADNSVVVGDVVLGEQCTVWFNAVIRGDVNAIRMGSYVNVQDGVIVHCTYKRFMTTIGSHVSIGHGAIVHGCTVEDKVLIGMGAIVMDGVRVGKGSVVAAGSVVLEGTVIEAGTIYAGVPAKKMKQTGKDMMDLIMGTAKRYPMYADWYKT